MAGGVGNHSPARGNSARERYAVAVTDRDTGAIDTAPLPEYSDDGVDLTLIRWMLSLTPRERLQFLEDRINDVLKIRERNART